MLTYPPFGGRGGYNWSGSRTQRPVCTFHFHHFPSILGSTGRGMKSSRKALWPTITDRTHIIHLDQFEIRPPAPRGGPAEPIRNPPALPDANSHSGPSPRNAPAWVVAYSGPSLVPSGPLRLPPNRWLGRYRVCTSYSTTILMVTKRTTSKVPEFYWYRPVVTAGSSSCATHSTPSSQRHQVLSFPPHPPPSHTSIVLIAVITSNPSMTGGWTFQVLVSRLMTGLVLLAFASPIPNGH
ncbi:hypothetical protein BO85DRAFT_475723 [Aspergillus piperis CBS 112811]|uniref:Uncharacterized protein n=1 Tax=Aspergillus piperis CBS 112811 TaxID=1448313 RepID=A0A8G1VQ14_9EURO|nr:hypothetical protein BO85DRAFT_475723 [Aspergillus piperis CBS 112811]RAH60277.1 hypothetical protein BO85DRAFT_475723 [Aspergillus piperis CBS 112811]